MHSTFGTLHVLVAMPMVKTKVMLVMIHSFIMYQERWACLSSLQQQGGMSTFASVPGLEDAGMQRASRSKGARSSAARRPVTRTQCGFDQFERVQDNRKRLSMGLRLRGEGRSRGWLDRW